MPHTKRHPVGARPQPDPSGLEHILGTIGGVLEHLPIAICIYDRFGKIVRYNQPAVDIWGRKPEPGVTHKNFIAGSKFFDAEGRQLAYSEMPLARVLETGHAVREQEFSVERPDGSRITTIVNINPLQDATGNVIGAINCIRDVTERKLIDEAFQRSQESMLEQEQRLAATYEHAAIGIAEIDAKGRFLRVNEAICHITGQSRQALLNGKLFDRTHPDDREADRDLFRKQVRGELSGYTLEKRYVREDGEVRWIAVKSTSVRDTEDRFLYGVRVVQDITERRQAEESQQLLIDELNHRTKNTLAIVQSLFWQTARDKHGSRELRDAFEGRLLALSKAHEQLTIGHWESAPLREIIAAGIGPYFNERDERIEMTGDDIVLKPKAALTLAMACHELSTNAAKYGALSVSSGRISVRWHKVASSARTPERLKIEWRESGGPRVVAPARRGFGSVFVEASIAADLQGTSKIAFEAEGVRCTMELPCEVLA
jgi:PAS domain S-box-containing protein